MTAIIRRATEADAESVVAAVRAVYDEYGFAWDADGYHADLANTRRHYGDAFWVADEDGDVVGTAGLELSGAKVGQLEDCDCSLERLYVLDQARGRGAGSALVRAVVDEARAHGRRRLAIWSDKRFEDAHRLYERLGARVVAERVHDDPDSSHEWGLALDLD